MDLFDLFGLVGILGVIFHSTAYLKLLLKNGRIKHFFVFIPMGSWLIFSRRLSDIQRDKRYLLGDIPYAVQTYTEQGLCAKPLKSFLFLTCIPAAKIRLTVFS